MSPNKTDVDIAVLQTRLDEISASLIEMRKDVKVLLTFRAFVWGGAVAVSAMSSIIVTLIVESLIKR
jgi:hypothetical protein